MMHDATMEGLPELREHLLLMSGRVDTIISRSVRALIEQDVELAQRTVEHDARINLDEIEIDRACLDILARGDLAPQDLRFVTLTLKMVTDLERIADLAVNICERAMEQHARPWFRVYDDIRHMAELAQHMIREAIDAFVTGNVDEAWDVINRDDVVDELHLTIFRDVVEMMVDDPATIPDGPNIIAVAKYLERMADHATNLGEQVVYLVEGEDIRHVGKLDHR